MAIGKPVTYLGEDPSGVELKFPEGLSDGVADDFDLSDLSEEDVDDPKTVRDVVSQVIQGSDAYSIAHFLEVPTDIMDISLSGGGRERVRGAFVDAHARMVESFEKVHRDTTFDAASASLGYETSRGLDDSYQLAYVSDVLRVRFARDVAAALNY